MEKCVKEMWEAPKVAVLDADATRGGTVGGFLESKLTTTGPGTKNGTFTPTAS